MTELEASERRIAQDLVDRAAEQGRNIRREIAQADYTNASPSTRRIIAYALELVTGEGRPPIMGCPCGCPERPVHSEFGA